ncbi:nuclear protein MDM1 isoform X4 [Archocentrus centrarchus]|uniref:nuclear protein MDM1 isoform X4 n=1 Tax=Archocentrus centrarchus TaxID=63155 RepID=UPI0011E9CCEF|nr:nuclear protein MDM1 isoform X4 [Archocentrus centrarchus]
MTVRFKNQTEYRRIFGASRSRSASPQRCAPLAGFRSNQMASRSRSAHRRETFLDPKAPTPPGANPGSPAEPEPPTGPRPAAETGAPERPKPAEEPAANGKSVKPRPSQPDSQPQPSQTVTAASAGQPATSGAEVDHAPMRKVRLTSGGERSGGQRSEYRRQFGWKKPTSAASPILTAEQALHSSSMSVPPFKAKPVPMETEYQRSFQGLAPPAGPRLRKHLEHQRVPLFHTYKVNRRRREESQKKPRPQQDAPQRYDAPPKATPSPPRPPQVQRGYRIPEGGGATDSVAHQVCCSFDRCGVSEARLTLTPSLETLLQVKELRQKALLYRHRAWGANFSRDHLSQLVSEHNALWEPTDTTVSATDPASPTLTADPSPDPDSHSTSCVEPLDLASHSSKRSSIAGSETRHVNKNTQTKEDAAPGPPAEHRTAWAEEGDQEEETTDEEEGRLPTPEMKMRPVQRTHHDLTTPAMGGAILVGKLRRADECSPFKQQRAGSAVSMAALSPETPVKRKEVWSDNIPVSFSPALNHKPSTSPKPSRTKPTSPPPAAPPPLVPPPQHGFQGTLRHPDFQHNGELGLRFRELPCSGGGCGSDEDDRLSVMSWRSAASCSMASDVLERAQKRREDFWGKR